MGFPEDQLGEGEHIIVDIRPHLWMLVPRLTIATAGAAALWGAAHVLPTHGFLEVARFLIIFQVVKVLLVGALIPVLRWWKTGYTVTNVRLVVRQGVFRRTALEIPLDRLVAVSSEAGPMQRRLGAGTLAVESGPDRECVTLKSVPRLTVMTSKLSATIAVNP